MQKYFTKSRLLNNHSKKTFDYPFLCFVEIKLLSVVTVTNITYMDGQINLFCISFCNRYFVWLIDVGRSKLTYFSRVPSAIRSLTPTPTTDSTWIQSVAHTYSPVIPALRFDWFNKFVLFLFCRYLMRWVLYLLTYSHSSSFSLGPSLLLPLQVFMHPHQQPYMI